MAPAGIVPPLGEPEDGDAGFGPCPEPLTVERLAFERGEKAFTYCIAIGVADRSHGWPDAGLLASEAEGD